MDNPLDQLKKSAEDIRFSAGASDRIRERLVAHMRAHPVVPLSPYQRLFIHSPYLAHMRTPVAALALLLLIGAGGATSFAAIGALPGDPLYRVKVSVIEPMQGFLAVSPEAKAAWKVSVTEARVNEAVQLAAKDKLTPEQGVTIRTDFDESLGTARETIDTLSKENPRAAAKLEASLTAVLDAHELALSAIASTSSSTSALEAHTFATHLQRRGHGKTESTSDKKGSRGQGDTGDDATASSSTVSTTETVSATTTVTTSARSTDSGSSSETDKPSIKDTEGRFFRALGF